MTYSFISRSRITLFLLILFSLTLTAKLFLVQIIHGDVYSESADRQYVTPGSNIYERGTIFFQGKNKEKKTGTLIAAASQAT